jgi:hypothetical protein
MESCLLGRVHSERGRVQADANVPHLTSSDAWLNNVGYLVDLECGLCTVFIYLQSNRPNVSVEQDRQCTYNGILWRVRVTIFDVEKQ